MLSVAVARNNSGAYSSFPRYLVSWDGSSGKLVDQIKFDFGPFVAVAFTMVVHLSGWILLETQGGPTYDTNLIIAINLNKNPK